MKVQGAATILLIIVAALLTSSSCKAQCTGGDHFVVCPSFDTIFIIQDWFDFQPHYLAAIGLLSGKLKWRVDLSQTMVHSNPAATADVVAFSTGSVPDQIEAFDAKTGKPAWKIRTKTYETISVGSLIIGDSGIPRGLIAIGGKTGKVVWGPPPQRRQLGAVLCSIWADPVDGRRRAQRLFGAHFEALAV